MEEIYSDLCTILRLLLRTTLVLIVTGIDIVYFLRMKLNRLITSLKRKSVISFRKNRVWKYDWDVCMQDGWTLGGSYVLNLVERCSTKLIFKDLPKTKA